MKSHQRDLLKTVRGSHECTNLSESTYFGKADDRFSVDQPDINRLVGTQARAERY